MVKWEECDERDKRFWYCSYCWTTIWYEWHKNDNDVPLLSYEDWCKEPKILGEPLAGYIYSWKPKVTMKVETVEKLIHKIELILIEDGLNDKRFKWGDLIQYPPSEVAEILRRHSSELLEIILRDFRPRQEVEH